MFGRSPQVVFESYGRRRSRWRLPRWLVLMLIGIGLGAGAVIGVQERVLPPRLSAGDSAALRAAFEEADLQRGQLRGTLAQTRQQLQNALSAQQAATEELASGRATALRLHEDLAALVAILPPDPRGGTVAVRAGRFTAQGGQLNYELVLTREQGSAKPLPSALQLLVAGESARGTAGTVSPKATLFLLGSHEVLRGSLPLPEGFKPRQTTVQVLDQAAGRPLGMRILAIK